MFLYPISVLHATKFSLDHLRQSESLSIIRILLSYDQDWRVSLVDLYRHTVDVGESSDLSDKRNGKVSRHSYDRD